MTGVYSVTYTDPSGCSSTSAPSTVLVNPNPSAPTITPNGPTTFCEGESVILSSSQGTGNVWSDGSTSQDNTVTSSGTYSVTYTDGNGCSATSAATVVTVNQLPVVDGGIDQTICAGDWATLMGLGNLTWTWDNGVIDGVPFQPTATTTYTGTGTDANGCSDSDQVTITVNDLPAVTISAMDSVCLDETPFPLTNGTPSGGTYSGAGVSNGNFDASAAGTGIHTITYSYTDANGCNNTATTDLEVVDCSTSGIAESTEPSLELYPNPATHELSIVFRGVFDYELVDSRGRLLMRGSADTSIDLNVSQFEAGVYFVNVMQDQKTVTARLIKQ